MMRRLQSLGSLWIAVGLFVAVLVAIVLMVEWSR